MPRALRSWVLLYEEVLDELAPRNMVEVGIYGGSEVKRRGTVTDAWAALAESVCATESVG